MAVVCAVHFSLISNFINAGSSAKPATTAAARLRLQVVESQSLVPQVRKQSVLQPPPAIPSEKPAAEPNAASADSNSSVGPPPPDKSSNDPQPFFNRDRFLDAAELDQPAVVSIAFEGALDKSLPATFDLIVLEFLIDENGQTVQLTCIDGDCSGALQERLQQLALMLFTPATKNGQPVASKKVIQILPTPTFGL